MERLILTGVGTNAPTLATYDKPHLMLSYSALNDRSAICHCHHHPS